MARALSAVLVLAALALAASGTAVPTPRALVLEDLRPTTDTYVAWRLAVPADALVTFDVHSDGPDADLAYVGLYILRSVDGGPFAFDSAFPFATSADGATYGHAEVPNPVGPVTLQPVNGHGAPIGVTVGYAPSSDVEWIVVAMVGSDAGLEGRITLVADERVRLLGRTTGPAFLLRESDFEGGVSLAAQVGRVGGLPGGRGASLMVKEIDGAAATVDVQHRLFGVYYGLSNTNDLQLSLDGPGGSESLPCHPNGPACEVHRLIVDEPGDRTFRIDHATDVYTAPACALVPCFPAPIYAFGADVVLP